MTHYFPNRDLTHPEKYGEKRTDNGAYARMRGTITSSSDLILNQNDEMLKNKKSLQKKKPVLPDSGENHGGGGECGRELIK